MTNLRRLLPLAALAVSPAFGLACSSDPGTGGTTPTGTTTATTAPDGAPLPTGTTLPDGALPPDDGSSPPTDGGSPGTANTVGQGGIAAWLALTTAQRNQVKGFKSVFLHQSVGGDLEDGAHAPYAAGGAAGSEVFKFEYYQGSGTITGPGLNGGLTSSPNGNGPGKVADWRAASLANRTTLKVTNLEFGYADINTAALPNLKNVYLAAVNELKAAGIKVLHATPPLVHDVSENGPKLQMREWMLQTFPNDVIFDLEDLESTAPDGSRCQVGGVWRVCEVYRVNNAQGCTSNQNPGRDGDGQGHLCLQTAATKIARAFLFAIYKANQ